MCPMFTASELILRVPVPLCHLGCRYRGSAGKRDRVEGSLGHIPTPSPAECKFSSDFCGREKCSLVMGQEEPVWVINIHMGN